MFGYMMLFLLLLLVVLWLVQVVFFEQIYKSVRIAEIRRSGIEICESIRNGEDFENVTQGIANERQICVTVLCETGEITATADTLTDCAIHAMEMNSIRKIYNLAVEEGGESLASFKLSVLRNPPMGIGMPPREPQYSQVSESSAESIIYTRLVRSETTGLFSAVILNATVSPVASTVRTLQTELIIISTVMILLAALLSFILARRVSKPIVRINDSSKRLAEGDYFVDFPQGGYREIAELSDTLSYAASELAKTEALQRELIANISHDLRTPLTMITGYAEVMRDIPGENTPENVQIIIDEAQRLTSLVNDVLDISRLQAGTQTLTVEQFDLTQTVREVIGRFGRLTDADGYVIRFDCDCNVIVNADRTRILQVIYNFINNAITHSGEDKTVIVTQRIIDREDGSKGVRIEVTDHGTGIEEKDIPYIWDRYYKVDKLHRRAQTGSGLGLSIVKGILELHRAGYGVTSEPGVGSTFWFEL